MVLVLATCLGLVAVLGACGTSKAANGDGKATSTTTTQTTPSTAASTTTSSIPVTGPSLATIAASKTVKIDGKTVKVPTDSGVSVAKNNDVADGQDVIISVGGFLPLRLYSTPSESIVWTNLTDQSQQVIFDHFPVTSPAIPPGGTFSWKSAASESISYHSASGMHAVVVINPPGI